MKKNSGIIGLATLGLVAVLINVGLRSNPKTLSEEHVATTGPEEAVIPVSQQDIVVLPTPEITPLIVSGEDEAPVWKRKTPAAHRSRIIHPDTGLLTSKPLLSKGDRLELALFDDILLSSKINEVTKYPNGAVGMTAQMDGEFKGTLYLSYSGGELRVHADVLGGNDFYVRYEPELQAHVAIEIDRENSDYQDECETCLVEQEEAQIAQREAAEAEDGDVVDIPDEPEILSDESGGDSVVVDVMVVYTPAALSDQGGTNGMNNNIALAMLKGNTTHGNSNTKVTLNLVHSAETTYTESGTPGDDLRILRYTGSTNSAMDEVHTWRETYSADFVCLFEDDPGMGGLGYVLNSELGRPTAAFNIDRVQQTDTGFTMVHELGHNMGCGHSATQASSPGPGPLYGYAAGWQWNDTKADENWPYSQVGYCSVMTYENHNGTGNPEYERVPHFSNPDINYIGDSTNATGDAATGDAARTIRNVRYVIADYRISDTAVTTFPCSNDFENAYSPWRYYGSDIDWERDRDGTPTPSSGPSSGNDGDWYVFTEASGQAQGDEALLQANFDFSALSSPQISFAYHMNDAGANHMGDLYLEVSTDSGTNWTSPWSILGNQGDVWNTTNINLSSYAGNALVSLRFRGVRGPGFRSDISLDSIVVQEVSTDSDGDGIPNDWETLYFGGPTNAAPDGNSDGDDLNNLQEYIAGLNPTNSDAFEINNLNLGSSNWLEWAAMTGRLYSVYWTDNLLTGFSILQSNLTSGAFTDVLHSAESEGFYKLEVEVAP